MTKLSWVHWRDASGGALISAVIGAGSGPAPAGTSAGASLDRSSPGVLAGSPDRAYGCGTTDACVGAFSAASGVSGVSLGGAASGASMCCVLGGVHQRKLRITKPS